MVSVFSYDVVIIGAGSVAILYWQAKGGKWLHREKRIMGGGNTKAAM